MLAQTLVYKRNEHLILKGTEITAVGGWRSSYFQFRERVGREVGRSVAAQGTLRSNKQDIKVL